MQSECSIMRWGGICLLAMVLLLGGGTVRETAQARPESPISALPSVAPAGAGATTFYTTSISIPTYPYHAYLYNAYNPTYAMSYPVLDWGAYLQSPRSPTLVAYQLLVMENAYLKVTLLPELGGRIYQLIDKATGQNHLYQNPVIKPTQWGPPEQGWWLAVGGIEWCLPVDEHGYEWGQPWQWSTISDTGGVTVTLRDTTANRVRATIEVALPADAAYVRITPRIENPTLASISYKFWINAALAPGPTNSPSGDLEFLLNANEMSVHSTGDDRFPCSAPTGPSCRFSWPVYNGNDFSQLSTWDEWLGFFEYPQAAKDFVATYDHASGAGIVRVFPRAIARGTKAFSFGWRNPLPWTMWTDSPSGFVELHGGVAPTFWDSAVLGAGEVLSWSEVWYPVHQTAGVSDATESATLHVKEQSGVLAVDLGVTSPRAASSTRLRVWDRATCTPLASEALPALTPLIAHHITLATGGRSLQQLAVVLTDTTDRVLAAYGPTTCMSYTSPPPHLGYGINIRELSAIDTLVPGLGFEWIKLWEEYSGLPSQPLPYNVLYLIGCGAYINDLNAWGNHVQAIAQAGKGIVKAYEICNESNVYGFWSNQIPNPARFSEMLCIANARIKAIDPDAIIVSGGLAPVGRITGTCNGWPGNNCYAMDERIYLQTMLANGAGSCIDAFGYHPYGFAYAPEQDPSEVSNGFAFRGAEVMHAILVAAGQAQMPVWATEFNWIRRPADDGYEHNCDSNYEYASYFKWQEVPAATQAAYLVRAFQYADAQWPWMHGMFVWNMDWHDYLQWIPCFHSRYYSLRRQDGTDFGAPTAAYTQLGAMAKRPGLAVFPSLSIEPARQVLLAETSAPRVITTSVLVRNTGYGDFAWTAALASSSTLIPESLTTSGMAGSRLWVVLDSTGLALGTYTSTITISADSGAVNSPGSAHIVLRVVPQLEHSYLPLVLRHHTPVYLPEGIP